MARFFSEVVDSSSDGFSVHADESSASSHGDAGAENCTECLIDGPSLLIFFEVLSEIGPGAFASKASELCDNNEIVFSFVRGVFATESATTSAIPIHALGKSKTNAQTPGY